MTTTLRTIVLAFLITFLMLPAQAFAQDATPSPDSQPMWSPRDTLNALLATPFPTEQLPAGTPAPEISQWLNAADSDLEGTIGAVQVYFGDDGISGVYFLVYPDDDAALQYYGTSAQAVAESQGTPVPLSEVPVSFYLDSDGYSVCVTLDRHVVIIGGATTPDDGSSTSQRACDYATAGQNHLDSIFEEQPQVIPNPQNPPTGLDILNQLIIQPFPEESLPANLSDPEVREWDYGDDDLDGAVGGATMSVAGDDTTGISWIVFPNEDDAVARYSQFVASSGTPVAVGEATPTTLQQMGDGYALCAGVEGQVLVIGAYTVDEGGLPETAQERACQLMAAGKTHVQKLFVAVEATPVANDAQSIFDALAAATFPANGLPPQFTDPMVIPNPDVDDAYGLVGQISVNVNGSELIGISYLVYPSVDIADQWMQSNAISIGQDHGPLGGEDGDTWNSYLVTNDAGVSCIAQADNVIVIGIADFSVENPATAACSLALAGLAHLRDVTS